MPFVSEACGSAAGVGDLNAPETVIFSSVHINVWCHVRAAIAQWDVVVSTVEGNACGWQCSTYGGQPCPLLAKLFIPAVFC